MSLMDLHYFPLWEGEVHDVLQECFGDLQSIFAFYCKVITHSNRRLLRDSQTRQSLQLLCWVCNTVCNTVATQHRLQHSATHTFDPPLAVHRRRRLCGGGR